MLENKKYKDFKVDLSRFDEDDYQYVKLAYGGNGAKRVLFILDYMPKEDLHKGKMLSGVQGDLLEAVLQTSLKKYGTKNANFQWMACTFNAFRTVGKDHKFVEMANEAFTKRLRVLISKYKPDIVVGFGKPVAKVLAQEELERTKGKFIPWLGRALPKRIKTSEGDHEFKFLPTLSLDNCCNKGGEGASLLGLMCRNLAYLFGTEYLVDVDAITNRTSTYVDTLEGFKKLMQNLEQQEKPVAIDTETKNLTKVNNRLLTIQFATDERTGFFLPFYHKDSPFTPKELIYVKSRLRDYFEGNNNNDYHIYANATFDLTVLKEDLKIRFFENDIWDIFAGEFAIDENLKATGSKVGGVGEWYYSLLNQSVQYGIEEYLDSEFSKDNRANFENTELTNAVIKYGTLDVCGPYAIHKLQKLRGKRIGYAKYQTVVRKEISDTIHSFASMEHTGSLLDISYLFYLNSDQSPIKLLVKDLEKKFLESDAAKKANKIISKASSVPTSSLFGDQQTLVKLNKKEHLQLIFFKVLGLKPLSKGKAGKGKKEGAGKLDKEFQGEYSSVPEVAMYTETQKAKKIRDAFVKSFIKKLKENPDVQKDKHIRSRYSYLKVVTHRTSSEDPNLQQIPSRGKLAKYIKRLFVAPEGHLYIKVDYQVHEIRGWGIISKDTEVAKAFEHGKKLRDQYKLNPASELAARIELEGDVHKINAAYFFKLKIEAIDKTIRDSVKAVVFGLIYGKGVKALSKDIKGTEKEAQELLDKFFKRFPKAVGWTNNIKKFAKEHLFTEALTGIRRNLWGFLIPESHPDQGKIHAQMSRQAGNSPIQGMCSKFMMNGIRLINKYTFQLMKQRGDFVLKTCNSVHDSLEALSKYENFMKSLSLIEWCLTDGVAQVVEERHGERLVSVPQIDMDIGSCLANVSKWDWSMPELYKLVKESLEFQRDELKYNVDVAKTLKMIFSQTEDYPKWLKQQVKNTGWKLPKYTDSRLEKETVES